mmetsp:Transcript_32216/g.44701  ORF Transcript_32216/g.44701 Transcript_32216/m.44701 type:complete len:226 (+) Transcript_32216:263-940(+)|eukprot:CAMPEP_0196570422 /NCGR_PEP_ID=MMETSP1081-20130531/502_1 /TAXON_ID=36882 /ORGANISM="Pyramimonas amylifera, Strain CCMP720" /LENGTH=225 /DNA_ID=CAMNT_0041886853 /DNA_START=257 /DNA_END=934 /DNA_ORIENTATION=-
MDHLSGWVVTVGLSVAATLALVAAINYTREREAPVLFASTVSAPPTIQPLVQLPSLDLTYEIMEQVTNDTEVYRHDLYEVDNGTRRSVAHAMVAEKEGFHFLDWIQSTKRGAGRELLTHLIETTGDEELAAFPTTHGEDKKSGGQALLTTAGFQLAPHLKHDFQGTIWALNRKVAESFLFDQSIRAQAGAALIGPSKKTRLRARDSDTKRFDEEVERFITSHDST